MLLERPGGPPDQAVARVAPGGLAQRQLEVPAVEAVATVADAVRPRRQQLPAPGGRLLVLGPPQDQGPALVLQHPQGASALGDHRAVATALDPDCSPLGATTCPTLPDRPRRPDRPAPGRVRGGPAVRGEARGSCGEGQRRRRASAMVENRSVWSVRPDHVRGARAVAGDAHLGAGVLLRAAGRRGAVGQRHRGVVGGLQGRGQAGGVGAGLDDLAGVPVVGGDDDRGVAVLLGEAQRGLHGLVEVDGLADLAAGVGGVVLLVDARALDLQEEALRRCGAVQQADRLAGHGREPGRGSRRAGRGWACSGAAGGRRTGRGGGRAGPVDREVAVGEQPEQRRALVGGVHAGEPGGVVDHAVAAGLGLVEERRPCVAAGRGGLGEGGRAAAEGDVGAGACSSCSVMEPRAAVLQRVGRGTSPRSPTGP